LKVKVQRKSLEASDIHLFDLVAADGSDLPEFTAGAHIDVHLDNGLVRQYSLCNVPGETHRYQIGVLRDPETRGGSLALHERVKEGDVLEISEPKNHFPLTPEAQRTLLFAGGIGITPMLAMAETLSRQKALFELHYCARSRSRAAFVPRIAAGQFVEQAFFHYDDEDAAQRLDLATVLATLDAHTHVYVCGPAGFIEWVLSTARSRGWPEAQLHVEYFSATPIKSDDDQSFEVKIASTGDVYTIPSNRTILEVLEEHGHDVFYSCGEGVCGTCLVGVVEGEPEHRDYYLSDDQRKKNDQILPCCSRSKSKMLVLDL